MYQKIIAAFLLSLAACLPAWAQEGGENTAATQEVELITSAGRIVLTLQRDKAPATVDNFLQYVTSGFYDGTIFHRVIDGFMIQGGGMTADMKLKTTRAPIQNEAKNGLKNTIGSLAMARTKDPHSATAQFFINVADNDFLDYPAQDGWGYSVFGRVSAGMDTVTKIARSPTGANDVPQQTILIESARLLPAAEQ